MKQSIIIALFSLVTMGAYAQDAKKVCQKAPNAPARAVATFPESAYTPTGDPSCAPCYTYKTKRGLEVMECPFLYFPGKGGSEGSTASQTTYTTVNAQDQRSYTGNYSKAYCARDPHMPKNGHTVYPKSDYIPTGNPACAPCYEYTTKRGLKVMECHDLLFPPEQK